MGVSVGEPKGKKGARPDINITPLVDVVLVLLIIFMVVTPQLEAGESVELPSILNVDPKSKNKMDTLTVTYTLSGKYFVEKDPFADVSALEARLKQEHERNPARRVILKGDERQTFAKMRDLFALISRCGFQGVSLMVSQKGGES
jgi:biopolymer transport protein ExbD/biopolymer transport protein TolR